MPRANEVHEMGDSSVDAEADARPLVLLGASHRFQTAFASASVRVLPELGNSSPLLRLRRPLFYARGVQHGK